MFDTGSVFDVLAADDSDRRVASRRALALAHTRVENQLGAFLRGAVTSDEFDSRLAQVQDEVTAHVASACEETGHMQPEHIAASLIDSFRVSRRWQPRGAAVPFGTAVDPSTQFDPNATAAPIDPTQQVDPALLQQQQMQMQQPMLPATDPTQLDPTQIAQQPQAIDPTQLDPTQMTAANNPSDQEDDSVKKVTCPECGGSKKTANGEPCQRCGGKGYVNNFGNSVLDSVAHTVTADGEAGLGGPEPKMDKRKWTPTDPGMPDDASKRWPTQHKDPLEVIPMTNRDQAGHDLSEIGEKTTETDDLADAASDDGSGFDTSTPGGKGPHTKTFPKGDQASPVTRESVN